MLYFFLFFLFYFHKASKAPFTWPPLWFGPPVIIAGVSQVSLGVNKCAYLFLTVPQLTRRSWLYICFIYLGRVHRRHGALLKNPARTESPHTHTYTHTRLHTDAGLYTPLLRIHLDGSELLLIWLLSASGCHALIGLFQLTACLHTCQETQEQKPTIIITLITE